LQKRAAEHHRTAVLLGQAGKCRVDSAVIGGEDVAGFSKEQDQRRIDHILACRAPVHPAGGLGIDGPHVRPKHLDEWNRGSAGAQRLPHQLGKIKARGCRGFRDCLRGFSGNHVCGSLGASQGRLEIEHRAKDAFVAEDCRQSLG